MKEQIIKYLEDKNLSDDIDIVSIENLIFNVEEARKLMDNIREEGSVISMSSERGTITKINPSVLAYNLALKNILFLETKLALTVQERVKLKLIKEDASQLEIDFHQS